MSAAQFASLEPPTSLEVETAEYLLLITLRRKFPGTQLNQSYMALAMAFDSVIEAQAVLHPEASNFQNAAMTLKAIGSILGSILGTRLEPNTWHEEIERLIRDVYTTAREQVKADG